MKNTDGGQLYTIEGFAAALIMIITAFLVVNATSVYTAGDTHISDMQLEALGTDALMTMGTPVNGTEDAMNRNTLKNILESDNRDILFRENFLPLVNANTTGPKNDIQFNASYSCRDVNQIRTIPFSQSRNLTGGEHTARATKWVIANTNCTSFGSKRDRAVLVEVLLWRD